MKVARDPRPASAACWLCALALSCLAGGCHTEKSFALAERRFQLGPERRTHEGFGVTLVRVDPDGTVVYQRDGQTLTAKPTQPMIKDLRAIRTDPAAQKATLGISGTWNMRERYFGPFFLSRTYD